MARNGFKGKIILVQIFTAEVLTKTDCRQESLSERVIFNSWNEYKAWLDNKDALPKMTPKEKEGFIPFEGIGE